MKLITPLIELAGVGPKRAKQLGAAGLKYVADVLDYFPRKYEDYSAVTAVSDIRPGLVCFVAKLNAIKTRSVRRGLHITEAVASDDSGQVKLVWFNQPYRAKNIGPAKHYYVRGEYNLTGNRLQITNPSLEEKSVADKLTAKIVPIYSERAGVKNELIRAIVGRVLPAASQLNEVLPASIITEEKLMPKAQAAQQLHVPSSHQLLEQAKYRMGFEEIFVLSVAAQLNKRQALAVKAPKIDFSVALAKDFVANLPFSLTNAQRKTVWQIYKDLSRDQPMNRLVEGDVGSGKTVVAAMAGIMANNSNLQVALLAPTELLAKQHYQTIKKLFAHSAFLGTVGLLIGGMKPADKKATKEKINQHQLQFVIGTHALIQEDINWKALGLVIIDEQHRFGVGQRQKISYKSGHMPHILCLTATPIPRSLALTVYGELDISILDTAPSTRAGVNTTLVSPNSTKQMYEAIVTQLNQGRQAYIVCPLITESEVLQVASAQETYETLRKTYFKQHRVALLHGKLKPAEKDEIMAKFRDGEVDVLVATTVIEVGVDVPNASEMVILGSNRFGLAQLHQLRGRVGRGQHKGSCYLVMVDSNAPSRRMQAIASTESGFELAELDLEIRGPGAIYGTLQHGALDLRFANITDARLIASVRASINRHPEILANMVKYKQLEQAVNKVSSLTYLN
jgi:ATP-dependent DNA helicase RecG